MAFAIQIRTDFDRFAREIGEYRRQVPYAAARALTDTARDVQAEVTRQLPSIFAKATPFTLKSVGSQGATKANLQAMVFVKDVQAKYLLHEEIGGTRTAAENTRKPSLALVLPGPALRLNPFGNIPQGTLTKLHAAAEADKAKRQSHVRQAGLRNRKRLAAAGRQAKQPARDQGVVFLKADEVPGRFAKIGGYFRRIAAIGDKKRYLQRLTTFKAETHYTPKFGFRKKVEKLAQASFDAHFEKRLAEAIETARR